MSVSATAVCQWHVTDNWRIKELYLHIYSPIYIFTHYICCTLPKNNMVTKSVKIGRNQKRKGSSPFCHQFSRAFAVSFKFGVWPTQTMHSYMGNHSNLPYTPTCNLRIYPWKRKIIFQITIFRFYVNLRGCTFWVLHYLIPAPNLGSHFIIPPNLGFIGDLWMLHTNGWRWKFFWNALGEDHGFVFIRNAPWQSFSTLFRNGNGN